MIRFGVVGAGWRTRFFLKVARACPDRFTVTGIVTRDRKKAAQWLPPYDVPLFKSLDDLIDTRPQFVITSVPWSVNPGLLTALANKNMPALSETPPATTVEEMIDLWRLVEYGAKIAVFEQYHLQPMHAARIAFVESGRLGRPTFANVSVAHGYHGISLIRRLLGITYEDAVIRAQSFTAPIVKSRDRDGYLDKEQITTSDQVIATLDFGEKLGVLDFVGDQYWSPIRGHRITVRGERGELIDDRATVLLDHRTPLTIPFVRHVAGGPGNIEGHYVKGVQAGEAWLYTNPFGTAELNDEEVSDAEVLVRMAEYAEGGACFYPLAEACQDRYLDILIWKSAETGRPVASERQPWAS